MHYACHRMFFAKGLKFLQLVNLSLRNALRAREASDALSVEALLRSVSFDTTTP